MKIAAKLVNELRQKTGAGMMDCKKALVESNGILEDAIDHLRKTGITKAEKKGSRQTKEGIIYSYIHAGSRLGVLVEVNCETDFVAKTDGFSELAHSIAMQIAATNPLSLDVSSLDEAVIEREKNIFTEQAKSEGKPKEIIEKMINGRLQKFYQESCLLEQTFIKDPDKTIDQLLNENNAKIVSFIRLKVGEGIEVESKNFADEVAEQLK